MSSTPTSVAALGSCPMEVLILSTSQSKRRWYSVLASESRLSTAAFTSMGLTMGPASATHVIS